MKSNRFSGKKKNSLFLKIFSINLLIILLAFMILSGICYARINAYLRAEHISSILTASSKVVDLSKRTDELYKELALIQQEDPDMNYGYRRLIGQIEDNYRNTLSVIASSTDFSVMQIAPDKKVLFRYADIKHFEDGIISTKTDPKTGRKSEYLIPSHSLDGMFSGTLPSTTTKVSHNGEDYYVYWGNMDNMFKTTTLTVMKPLYQEGSLSSMLILFIPTPQIKYLLNVVASNFLLASIFSLIFSIILSYALSYRISRPLKAMNEVAMKLASGDFSKRVNTDDNNIGEISELISTFNDMAEAIENTEENQRAFTASIAHELRTPMTSIIGFIDSILDGTIPPDKASEYLGICLSEARRLSKLTNELLDVSRIESGTAKLDMEAFDINECIRRQIVKYQDQIAEKNLEIAVEFEEEECICCCDKDSITRVFINLLDNAIKFSYKDGYIKIVVGTHSGKAHISIENSGDGIPKNDIKHIFDKFYKTDKSRGLDKKGVGLGLYLVKNILSLHGESITVSSVEGEFTKFTFSLSLFKNHHKQS